MNERGIDVDVTVLDPREIPNPAHVRVTAKRCIRQACAANEHDWADLIVDGETAYWRECRTCGIADVTAGALGQGVETPNDYREGA